MCVCVNVTIYGDSIMKGILLENGRYIINREWEERFAGAFCGKLVNRSRFGCTIRKALEVIRRDSGKDYAPGEYALLEFGGNDCDYNWARISEDPAGEYDCKTPPSEFKNSLREAVSLIRSSGRKPVLVTLPPIDSERYLRFICRDGLSRENILRWLGDVNAIARWQKRYSDMAAELAGEEGARLIDLRGAFLSDGRAGELLCSDGIHPSRSGQSVIFNTLCAVVA